MTLPKSENHGPWWPKYTFGSEPGGSIFAESVYSEPGYTRFHLDREGYQLNRLVQTYEEEPRSLGGYGTSHHAIYRRPEVPSCP